MTFRSRHVPVLLLLAGFTLANGEKTADSTESDTLRRSRALGIAVGASLLGVEYIAGPIIAKQAWWKEGFNYGNPFNNLKDNEPYTEDDAWHFAACNMVTELHYRILDRGFGAKHAVPIAATMTFVTYTTIECLDAMEKTGRWGFSVRDEMANCLGIGFWVLKHYRPDIPVRVRVGVRKWGDVLEYVGNSLVVFEDYDAYRRHRHRMDMYSILKVEAIYDFYEEFHAGVAVSKKTHTPTDLWGVTFGCDLLRLLARANKDRKWYPAIRTLTEYGSASMAYTWWFH
jgi:hypothetical protein